MRRARHSQRDLFDEATPTMELRPDLRTKLTPLLQALLAEAAGVEPRQARPEDFDGSEGGDDQDHA
ncbi:hypothetical protein [Reyranella sp.]|jgi:hypothetical protein|uniref:hypothetical protein n=1 Tax=Reyranella sp. TaxID=1929291 RepID=UPI002F94CA4D